MNLEVDKTMEETEEEKVEVVDVNLLSVQDFLQMNFSADGNIVMKKPVSRKERVKCLIN